MKVGNNFGTSQKRNVDYFEGMEGVFLFLYFLQFLNFLLISVIKIFYAASLICNLMYLEEVAKLFFSFFSFVAPFGTDFV